MASDNRIINVKVDVSENEIRTFFEDHTRKPLQHLYNYVLFQDDDPELAIERDRAEKQRILPILNVSPTFRILDIGCGVGRWADTLVPLLGDGEMGGGSI